MNSDASPGQPRPISTDLRNLFSANGGHTNMLGLPAPSATVFSTPWADVALDAVAGTSFVSVAELSTTTVANAAYDVAAGSRVELLVLALDGPIRLPIGVSTLEADYKALGAYAADAARVQVQDIVRAWLAKTSRA